MKNGKDSNRKEEEKAKDQKPDEASITTLIQNGKVSRNINTLANPSSTLLRPQFPDKKPR